LGLAALTSLAGSVAEVAGDDDVADESIPGTGRNSAVGVGRFEPLADAVPDVSSAKPFPLIRTHQKRADATVPFERRIWIRENMLMKNYW